MVSTHKLKRSFPAVLRVLCALSIDGFFAAPASPEIIDRVAVTVDNQVITLSQVMNDIRVTAFLNGKPPDFSSGNRRATADRLVEVLLISREMEVAHYPQPTVAEITEAWNSLRERYGGDAGLARALAGHGLTRERVEAHLLRVAATLRFIELRFKPEIQIQEGEMRQYYETVFVPEWKKTHTGEEPPYDEARAACEQALAAEMTDRRVDEWLKETRARSRIRYEPEAFQ